jgi:hypothetical protein
VYLLPYLNSRYLQNVSEYVCHLCNPYLVRKSYSNLVVESRVEILFKGGRL